MAYWTDLKTFCATTYVDVAFAYLFLSFKYLVFVITHAKAFAVISSALFKNAIRQLGRNKQMARGRLHDLCFTSLVIFLKAEMICKRW